MNQEVFSKYDSMTVGEMSSTTLEHCVKYTKPERNELSMTFNFHHLKVDYPDGEKWEIGEMDFQALKQILSKWQVGMNEGEDGMPFSGVTMISHVLFPVMGMMGNSIRNLQKCLLLPST